MDSGRSIYPMRAVIRCKAKQAIMARSIANNQTFDEPLDEVLFQEIATTWFKSKRYDVMYRNCLSAADSLQIEDRVASELAETYQQIKAQQRNTTVQQLNALLYS